MEIKTLKVGAGKADIKIPEEYMALENFGMIHDSLHARAIIIQQEITIAIISLELTSLPEREVEVIKEKVTNILNIEAKNIWICVTHTFSAPHILSDSMLKEKKNIEKKEKFRTALHNAVYRAILKAYDNLQEAELGYKTGFSNINTNRDVELEDGWWIGRNGHGISDKTVSILRFNNKQGIPIAILYHYAIQSSVLDGVQLKQGKKVISGDIVGRTSAYLEEKMAKHDTVALFMLGAAGDQSPTEKAVNETFENGVRIRQDCSEKGFHICEKLGNILGKVVYDVTQEIICKEQEGKLGIGICEFIVPGKEMNRDIHSLHPTRSYEYISTGDQNCSLDAIRIGNIAILGVKPELNCITAITIRAESPFIQTLVTTMANGACKYMADKVSYERMTYEAMNSPFGKGAAEILSENAVKLLKEMREK